MRAYYRIVSLFLIALWLSCSEQRIPVAVPTHPAGWMDTQSPNFHGKVLLVDSSLTLRSCQSCHGEDFRGGKAGIGCYGQGCHISFPHPEGFAIPGAEAFHGRFLQQTLNYDLSSCQHCHGENFEGGDSKVSCYGSECHRVYPHPEGFADEQDATFHGVYIAENVQWNLRLCRPCHGRTYGGKGIAKKNCRRCHTQDNGPEACNTCHGDFEAPVPPWANAAPPKDLGDHTLPEAIGVGAHPHHLADTTLTTAYARDCRICHLQPDSLFAAGHVDNLPLPAEVQFNPLAADSGRVLPLWNREQATCASVYCHGAFVFYRDSSQYPAFYADSVITGNFATVIWNQPETGQAECGTCHGLPPTGHLPVGASSCANCHQRVVDADLNIIGKDLHINGRADVF
ncbi:MAG: hypothetical protein GXO78_08605 [Calditrichaeota bacterium]|nr:hypothetical protein [Calditrichota bacterium]